MPKRSSRAVLEWVGGTASLPAFVAEGDEPWRPQVLLWLSAEGAILGSMVANPSEVLGLACDNLRETIARPAWGEPHAPTRVRVATPELAAVLAAGFPDIEVVCAPTPELEGVVEDMQSHMLATDDDASWFSPQVDAGALASFFHAAAALYRRRPWDVVPGDQGALFVSIPSLEVVDAPLMVIGQLGESFGLLLFDSEDELEQFGSAMEAMEEGGQPDVPPYLVLNFERGAELAPGLRREIAVNHWEVASVDAYPVLLSMQPGMLSRPATARELAVMEVVALALPMLLDDVEALQEAWGGGDDSICSMCVDGYGGEFDVVIGTCPSDGEDDPEDELSGAELMDILADIASDAEERGDDRREARQHYEDLLLAPFHEGAEGLSHDAGRWSRMLFDILAQPGGVPLPKLYPAALEDALFRDLPKQADVLIDDADDIVDELRGVFLFLACVTDHATAGACADVLRNPAAADRLRLAITQRRRARATRTQGTRGKGTESGKGKGKGKGEGEGGGKR